MAAYRVYLATFPFAAREASELSISVGDTVFVYEKPGGGGWPDPEKWMRGTNNGTGETGDFPGTYCEYVEEVSPSPPPVAERSPTHAPAPPASNGESAPPVPPRRPKTSLPRQASPPPGVQPPMPVPRRNRFKSNDNNLASPTIPYGHYTIPEPQETPESHEWFKVTFQLPVQCVACDDFIWGSTNGGCKCERCFITCHTHCMEHLEATRPCSNVTDDEALSKVEYTHTVGSFKDYSLVDIELWMKAVQIDAYYEQMCDFGVKKGADLKYIGDSELQQMGVQDELHRQIIMECLDELCKGTSSMVPVEGMDGDEVDLGENFRRLRGVLPNSPSISSIQSMFGALGKKRGDKLVGGHHFKTDSFTAPRWCDVCGRFMWGLVRQGMKCKGCRMVVHRMCMVEGIPGCDVWQRRKAGEEMPAFGIDITAQFDVHMQPAPTVVLKCLQSVESGGIHLEGIYRVSPSLARVNRLKAAFDKDAEAVGMDFDEPRVFSAALKLYLRELPIPILTYDLYDDFIAAGRASGYDAVFSGVEPLLERLPAHHRSTLDTILKHLAKVATYEPENKMSIQNLALIFGPTLIRPPPENISELVNNSEIHCKVIQVLMVKGHWLAPPEEPSDVMLGTTTLLSVEPPPNLPPVVMRPISPVPRRRSTAERPPPPPPPSSPPPPATPLNVPIHEQSWYWGNITREDVSNTLRDRPDGSFLVRDSTRVPGEYTLTVRKAGTNKLIRIIYSNGKYGFSETTTHANVADLIQYYTINPLTKYNPRLDITLCNPVSRFGDVDLDDDEDEEESESTEVSSSVPQEDPDVILDNLIQTTELFDQKNGEYMVMEQKSEALKKEAETQHKATKASELVVELFREQLMGTPSGLSRSEKNTLMENGKRVGKKLQESQKALDQQRRLEKQHNMDFRTLDRDLNTLRPVIKKLLERKKSLHAQLVQLGWTAQRISEQVKQAAINESENIYGTIYAGLHDGDADGDAAEDNPPNIPSPIHIPPVIPNQYVSSPSMDSPPPPTPPRHNPSTPGLPIFPRTSVGSPDSPFANNAPRAPFHRMSLVTPTRNTMERPKSWVDPSPSLMPTPPPHQTSNGSEPPPAAIKTRTLRGSTSVAGPAAFGPAIKLDPVGKSKPHERIETWFREVDRTRATELLKDCINGTFLCRPTSKPAKLQHGGLHTHTIDVVYNGMKHIKVVQHNGKYGFSVPCTHKSLMELILHFSENSLVQHNPGLHTTLQFPVDKR